LTQIQQQPALFRIDRGLRGVAVGLSTILDVYLLDSNDMDYCPNETYKTTDGNDDDFNWIVEH
jgi:hypothetical protein